MLSLYLSFIFYSLLQKVYSQSCSQDLQYDALYSLFNSTNGDDWNWINPINMWKFDNISEHPCRDNWEGIICNNCDIIALNISSHNLTGRLPHDISNLIYLEELSLGNNSINGDLSDIVELSNLVILNLEINLFNSSIPNSIN